MSNSPPPRLVPDRPSDAVQTGPYVDRIVRIFRDRPYDDTTALVLIDFAQAAIAARDAAAPPDEAPGEHVKVLQAILAENEATQVSFPDGDWWKAECDALRAAIQALAAAPAAPATDTRVTGGREVITGVVNGYLHRAQCVEFKADAPLPVWLTESPGLRVTLALQAATGGEG